MPLVNRGDDLFDADRPVLPPDLLPQFLDIGERLADLSLPAMRLGDYPSNCTAMPGDDDRLAALRLVERMRETSLSFGGLYLLVSSAAPLNVNQPSTRSARARLFPGCGRQVRNAA
jgi:hypothetical protein